MLAVTHPNLASLFGTSKDADNLYFVMSPTLGGPLHKHFRASLNGRFAVNRVKFYTAEIASGLMTMHSLGYVHRDIKASNVLLSATGNCVLSDFGYAKKLDEGERTYTFCGTLHAMSPEIASKSPLGHDAGCDWWSLGILVYEMLVGAPPFGYGDDREDCIKKIGEGPEGVVFMDEVFDGVGRPAKELIKGLLTVDEANRKTQGYDSFQAKWFFEGGVVTWNAREGGGHTVSGNIPEFNDDLGDLDVFKGEDEGVIDKQVDNDAFAGF
jgi:serine/threonine protein kinase